MPTAAIFGLTVGSRCSRRPGLSNEPCSASAPIHLARLTLPDHRPHSHFCVCVERLVAGPRVQTLFSSCTRVIRSNDALHVLHTVLGPTGACVQPCSSLPPVSRQIADRPRTTFEPVFGILILACQRLRFSVSPLAHGAHGVLAYPTSPAPLPHLSIWFV
jgi:hypothetical protein